MISQVTFDYFIPFYKDPTNSNDGHHQSHKHPLEQIVPGNSHQNQIRKIRGHTKFALAKLFSIASHADLVELFAIKFLPTHFDFNKPVAKKPADKNPEHERKNNTNHNPPPFLNSIHSTK